MGERYDAIVIGSGASGAVAADTLVKEGMSVLLVEEGPRLEPNVTNAALDDASPKALARASDGRWTTRGWPWTTRNLGGGTVFYGGASFRYQPFDFDPTERIVADDLNVRWPIGLADLLPFYEAVERRLSVDPASIGEWPADRPAPSTLSLPGEELWSAARRLGWSPQPTPLAIDRRRCDACSLCICVLCTRGAKRDALTEFLAPLLAAPGFTVRTGVRAAALVQARPHRADELLCIDTETGVELRFAARLFVIAANAIQSAALLLRSASTFQPQGMGNRHDLVGRGLCMKLSEYTVGRIAMPRAEIEAHPLGYRGPFSTVAVLDHYLDACAPTGVGGLIYEAKYDEPGLLAEEGLVLRVETILADHPAARNRVRLRGRKDRLGLPELAIDYRVDRRDAARLAHMKGRSVELLRACGAADVRHEGSGFTLGSTHLHGTCRAGDDPARAVVDRDGRLHEMDNVFVADGSYMPYPGGLNPTLTIQANALRIALRIVGKDLSPPPRTASPSTQTRARGHP